jgi:hypothetical protein
MVIKDEHYRELISWLDKNAGEFKKVKSFFRIENNTISEIIILFININYY